MRIDSSTIGMESARRYTSTSASITTLRGESKSGRAIGQGNDDTFALFSDLLGNEEANESEEGNKDNKVSEENVIDAYLKYRASNTNSVPSTTNLRDMGAEFRRLHELMIKNIFQLLFGNRKACSKDDMSNEVMYDSGSIDFTNLTVVTTEYTSVNYFSETEATHFNAEGIVKTVDGKEINVNLSIGMSRSFAEYSESYFGISTLQVTDPLVINFDGNSAGLSPEMSFFFDLDTDGEKEQLAGLNSGSGFLALDLNEDGIINDGSELFGTKSGDGFADLAKYDEDGDGWIDEDDSVFDKLKIWVRDADGNNVLYSLKDKNIGAIYTGSARTDFSLNDLNNATMGYIRATGLFLYEDGAAGTVQHVDLVS